MSRKSLMNVLLIILHKKYSKKIVIFSLQNEKIPIFFLNFLEILVMLTKVSHLYHHNILNYIKKVIDIFETLRFNNKNSKTLNEKKNAFQQ